MVPREVQGGGKSTPWGQAWGKQEAWHLVQQYRSWAGTEISLYAKDLVYRHRSVNAPGSALNHLEFGG